MEGSDGPVHVFNPFRTFVARNYKARMLMVKDTGQNLVVSLCSSAHQLDMNNRFNLHATSTNISRSGSYVFKYKNDIFLIMRTCLHAYMGILTIVIFENYLNVSCLFFSISLDFHLKFYDQNGHGIRTTRQ